MKVFQQITTHVGRGRLSNLSDKPNLKYLDAVIRGIHRFVTLEVTGDLKLKGYAVPKGSLLLVNFATAHHDTQPWGDPDNFCTERFLDADGNPIKDPQDSYHLDWGKDFVLEVHWPRRSSSYGCRPCFNIPGLRLRTLLESYRAGKGDFKVCCT